LTNFSKAIWEVRKQDQKKRLGKRALARAFKMSQEVGKNKERFKELIKNV